MGLSRGVGVSGGTSGTPPAAMAQRLGVVSSSRWTLLTGASTGFTAATCVCAAMPRPHGQSAPGRGGFSGILWVWAACAGGGVFSTRGLCSSEE